MINRNGLVTNTSTSLQTLGAEAYLAGRQFSLREQILKKAKSDTPSRKTKTNSAQKRVEFKTKIKVKGKGACSWSFLLRKVCNFYCIKA
jgi:hypothetical protein